MNQAKSRAFCLMQIKDIGGFTLNKKIGAQSPHEAPIGR